MADRSIQVDDATQRNLREAELLARFRDGDRSAFQPLLHGHVAAIRGLAVGLAGDSHGGDDLVQEALVRAYQGLGGFRGECRLRSWLFRIVVRLASEPSRWHRGGRAGTLDLEVPEGVPAAASEGPEAVALGRELRHRLDEAMERLPTRQRAALILRASEGLDYAGVGAVLECTPGAARMLVLEARRRVRERMGSYLDP